MYSRTNNKILENLYEETPILNCTINGGAIILDCNESFATRLGYSRIELVGMSFLYHAGGDESAELIKDILRVWKKAGVIINREIWLKRKDGNIFPALLNASSLHGDHGELIGCNVSLIDESDIYESRRNVERTNEELRYREKLKNEFIAIASHELRTPIQPILGFAILAKRGKINQDEAWEGVLKEARRLQQLANDILDVSRIESSSIVYRMERMKISDLLEDVIESAKTNLVKKITLELDVDPKCREIEIELDRSRIIQVLANLVGNAIKFTETGAVKLQTIAYPDKNKIEISIVDTGSGIPESIMPNLFGKFVTKSMGEENRHGTGLGLFISKAIVTAHRGEIFANNNESNGATFTVVLPIDQNKKKI